MSDTDTSGTSLARTRTRTRGKRRVAIAMAFALLVAAIAAFVSWRHLTISAVAGTVIGEIQPDATAPKLQADDTASTQGKSREKITSSGTLTPRPAAQPAEEESYLASIFKDLKNQTPEVCGMSAAEAKAFIATDGTASTAITYQLIADATVKLLQSNNLHEKATGMYLFAQQAGRDAAASERLNYPGCKNNNECSSKPFYAAQAAIPVNAEPLVNLALDSNDISVYATALYACSGSTTGACAKISYARWAQMEPNNAAAWMMVASEAEKRKDSAARAAALQRAVSASDYKTRLPTLVEVLASDEIQAQTPIVLASTLSMVIGMNAASSIPSMVGFGRHCGRLENMDESRRATCDALATKMAEKDETLMGLMMARSIGERTGWSAERLQPLKDEFEVYTGQIFDGISTENMFSCEAVSKQNQLLLRTFTLGERGAMREIVKNSGKTLAELAAIYRAQPNPLTK